jgi:hypothetical protein
MVTMVIIGWKDVFIDVATQLCIQLSDGYDHLILIKYIFILFFIYKVW